MKTEKEKLESLDEGSIWRFPKQDVSFDNAFRAAKLFYEIAGKENVNIEEYFEKNYARYGIKWKRHRVLAISQMYGLLTKNNFYKRGLPYSKEKTTSVFEMMNRYKIGEYQYNVLKTEQILKIKMKSIIDTTKYCEHWNIYAVIYAYYVLNALQELHSITKVPLEQFYTYVMTCGSFEEFDETINLVKNGGNITKYYEKYVSDSRFVLILKENIKLFKIEEKYISINPDYRDYFEKLFVKKYSMDELNKRLQKESDYADFLHNPQQLGVNLIDLPKKGSLIEIEIKEDIEYVSQVDSIDDSEIVAETPDTSYKVEPKQVQDGTLKVYPREPKVGKKAIKKAGYSCEYDNSHITFASASTGKPFMEAHHLISMTKQQEIWNKYGVNVDCVENVVSLCPNCHRAIHLAKKAEREKIIKKLYEYKKDEFEKIGLCIELKDIL